MRNPGIGLIGTGFMGKCHALAYRSVATIFPDVLAPDLITLCDQPLDQASKLSKEFGFSKATDDWQSLLSDPDIDIISITTPNKLHHEIALAALQSGKHVYCEKPLSLTISQAREMANAAGKSRSKTIVGYNYLCNPAIQHARELIHQGAIGRITHFRGVVDEDYQADPDLPWTWRVTKSEAGLGALGDLGCHLVSIACTLVGPIESLVADMQTIYAKRPDPDGGNPRPVENEDVASALLRFENGVQGSMSTSRSAWGRKNYLVWEVHGDRGMLTCNQERMNELRLYENKGPVSTQGFKTILSGPAHPSYGAFCPAPGHGLGFNDLKVIELAGLLKAIEDNKPASPSFSDALHFEEVIHAISTSATSGERVEIQSII
ncbi:MAG: Gfo/Idh/MocA family oxidoreductase [Cohaesibacteraceae bacterium]|nr:Gfo/Idh/MocA family oxidoreductase [Cohaesibacteraceae bacterium]MBL4876646.1 Gfo/Idh/MocA family oxidoreductase [Cohaesibacteraceae bacterium]